MAITGFLGEMAQSPPHLVSIDTCTSTVDFEDTDRKMIGQEPEKCFAHAEPFRHILSTGNIFDRAEIANASIVRHGPQLKLHPAIRPIRWHQSALSMHPAKTSLSGDPALC